MRLVIMDKSVVKSTRQLATTIVQEETEWLHHMARIKEGKVALLTLYSFHCLLGTLSAWYTIVVDCKSSYSENQYHVHRLCSGHAKLISCFWSYKSLKNDQATRVSFLILFRKSKLKENGCTNSKMHRGGWGLETRLQNADTCVSKESKYRGFGWWSHWVQVV